MAGGNPVTATCDVTRLMRGCTAAEARAAGANDAHWTPLYLGADGMPVIWSEAASGARVVLELPLAGGAGRLVLEGTLAALPADEPARARHARFAAALRASGAARRVEVARATLARGAARETLEYAALARGSGFGDGAESRMVEHMNDDHVDALVAYCAHAGVACRTRAPAMVGIDQDGFYLHADDGLVRFAFDAPCATPLEVRTALVELARRARAPAD
jgi:hypothetical protein